MIGTVSNEVGYLACPAGRACDSHVSIANRRQSSSADFTLMERFVILDVLFSPIYLERFPYLAHRVLLPTVSGACPSKNGKNGNMQALALCLYDRTERMAICAL